ncbi:MAG: DNA polymerase [Limnohabitans sp.]|nr:DNA polymerase [Limnohabitans sp.]
MSSFIEFIELNSSTATHHRFHRKVTNTQFKIKHNLSTIPDLFSIEEEIDNTFFSAINKIIKNSHDLDVISITITHDNLSSPIYINRRKNLLKKEDFLNSLIKVSQSDKTFLLDGVINMKVGITEHIHGKGKVSFKKIMTIHDYRKQKKCIIKIKNNDSRCGFIAINMALKLMNCSTNERRQLIRNNYNIQNKLADDLLIKLNLPLNSELNTSNLEYVCNFLSNLNPPVQLVIINGHTRTIDFKSFTYETKIWLELFQYHYNIITSMKAYVNKSYYCDKCFVGYDKKLQHKCKFYCDFCMTSNICAGVQIYCCDCNKYFKGNQCLNNHKLSGVCEAFQRCRRCDIDYEVKSGHSCCIYNCKKCHEQYNVSPHYCYIKTIDKQKILEEDSKIKVIVVFDIESALLNENNFYIHKPNLLISLTVCDLCSKLKTDYHSYFCKYCGNYENIFTSFDCVSNFGDYIFKKLNPLIMQNKSMIYILAHNFKGYDGHFILQDIFKREFFNIETIMNGSKILCIKINNIIFFDSLSFFLQPLSSLPKSFGFENIVIKGYFPFYLNKDESLSYNGSFPDKSLFGIDTMTTSKLKDFNNWYEMNRSKMYDLKSDALKYCKNDVLILMLSIIKFREQFKNITEIDPLTRNFTLASIGLEVFRTNFLKEYTIGITPIAGYSQRNGSIHCDIWLDYNEMCIKDEIIREYRVGRYYADGYNKKHNTIYEYFGCFYHGCLKCYKDRSSVLNLRKNEYLNVDVLYEKVKRKLYCYNELGFKVIKIWECDFLANKKIKQNLKDYYNKRLQYYISKKRYGGVSIRESFYGGRTNNLRFWYIPMNNETIEYKDVCSEYPFVLKTKFYPIGHPKIIRNYFDETLKTYFGFIKCIICPPKKLFLPVLPLRVCGKLLFPLCKICAVEKKQESCNHSEEERALIGTWTSVELQKAISLGYYILTIIEVLHYENKSDNMFKNYINLWLKEKQEASGWPTWVKTENDKKMYLDSYFKNEGVSLNPQKIEKNPGRRFIAKIMLNSFWGKFSQRPNLAKTKICKDFDQYWSIINNDQLTVEGEEQIDENNIILCYKFLNDENAKPGNTNIAISSFVTAYARLHLYYYMEKILKNGNDRLLYFDTDSIIYISKNGDSEIITGDYLGDLTDEIKDNYGNEARITKFCSAGPKNYALEIENGNETKVILKTKGITNYACNINILNIQEMIKMVNKFIDKNETQKNIFQTHITSHKFKHYVKTKQFEKVYKVVSEKRRIIENCTLPFGYVD